MMCHHAVLIKYLDILELPKVSAYKRKHIPISNTMFWLYAMRLELKQGVIYFEKCSWYKTCLYFYVYSLFFRNKSLNYLWHRCSWVLDSVSYNKRQNWMHHLLPHAFCIGPGRITFNSSLVSKYLLSTYYLPRTMCSTKTQCGCRN